MKRLITILALALVCIQGYAQLNIQTSEAPTKVWGKLTGPSIYKMADIYSLMLISSNRYDDPIIIELGKGVDSALQSLSDLEKLLDDFPADKFVKLPSRPACSLSKGPTAKSASVLCRSWAGNYVLDRATIRAAIKGMEGEK